MPKDTITEHSYPEESSSSSYATAVQGDLSHSVEENDEKLPTEQMSDDTIINIYTRETREEKEQQTTRGLFGRLGKMVSNRVLVVRKADPQSSTEGLHGTTQAAAKELVGDFPTNSSASAESSRSPPPQGWEVPCVETEHAILAVDGSRADVKKPSSGNMIDCVDEEAEGGTFVNASTVAQVASLETKPPLDLQVEASETLGTNMEQESLQPPFELNTSESRKADRADSRDGESATGSMVDVSIGGAGSIDAADLQKDTSPPQNRPNVGLLRRIGKLIAEPETPKPPSQSLVPLIQLDDDTSFAQVIGSREEGESIGVSLPLDNPAGLATTSRAGSILNTDEKMEAGGDAVDHDDTMQSCGLVSYDEAAFSTNHARDKDPITPNQDDTAKQPSSPQSTRPLLNRTRWIKSVRNILSSRSIERCETKAADSSKVCDLPGQVLGGDEDQDDAVDLCESESLVQGNNGDSSAVSWPSSDGDSCDVVVHPTRRGRLVTAVKQLVEVGRTDDKDQPVGTEGGSSEDCLDLSATSEPQREIKISPESSAEQEIICSVEATQDDTRFESGNGLENPATELGENLEDVVGIDKCHSQHRMKWMTTVRKVLSTRSFEGSALVADKSVSSVGDGDKITEVAVIERDHPAAPDNNIFTETVDKSTECGDCVMALCPSSPKNHQTENFDVTIDDQGEHVLAGTSADSTVGHERGGDEEISKDVIQQGKTWAASVRKVLRARSFSNENIVLVAEAETREFKQIPPEVSTLDKPECEQGNARQNLQRQRWITSMRNILSTRSFGGNECAGGHDVTDMEVLPVGGDGISDEECTGESALIDVLVGTHHDDSSSPECTGSENVVLGKPKLLRTRWITSVRGLMSTTPHVDRDVGDLDGSSSAMGPAECGEEVIEFEGQGEQPAVQSSALNSFMATKGGWKPTDISSGLALVDEELGQNPSTSRREFLQGLKRYLEQEQVKVSTIRASTEETLPNEAQARVA